MSRRRRRPGRGVAHYAAPVAFLAGVTIAVLLVHSALNHHTSSTATTVATTTQQTTTSKQPARRPTKRFYVVQTGDTFGTIAAKVGISVARLAALNPGVSSNALRVGQKLRTR
jgi:LysM repeat protein